MRGGYDDSSYGFDTPFGSTQPAQPTFYNQNGQPNDTSGAMTGHMGGGMTGHMGGGMTGHMGGGMAGHMGGAPGATSGRRQGFFVPT